MLPLILDEQWQHSAFRGISRIISIAVTNARFASLQGFRSALSPSRPRPFRFSNRVFVTSEHLQIAAIAGGFRLRLGGGTLRSGCVPLGASLRSPLHFPRSPTTDRSQKNRIRGQGAEFANQ